MNLCSPRQIMGCTLLGVLWSHQSAAAADVSIGVGIELARDLVDKQPPGQVGGEPAVEMGLGPALRMPVLWSLSDVVRLRSDLRFAFATGHDRVEWTAYEGRVRYFSTDHWALVTSTAWTAGPEIVLLSDRVVSPYWGSAVGIAWVQHWHSFHGASTVLLDPSQNDLKSDSNVDPYSSQLAPVAGMHTGVGIDAGIGFAIHVEAGYYVSFIREAVLRKAPPELGAVRAAYGSNEIRFGVSANFPLGPGREK